MKRTIFLLIACSSVLLAGCSMANCHGNKKITNVGGCNNFGKCGVKYSDGTEGLEDFPVEGGLGGKIICK